jgi:hypothetical protein
VCGGETEKIKTSIMNNDYENGGLKMPNIQYFSIAQKVHWMKRVLDKRICPNEKYYSYHRLSHLEITFG